MDDEKFSYERRRYPRVNADLPVQLKELQRAHPLKIQNSLGTDISEGGMRTSSAYFYPVNNKLTFEIFVSLSTEPVRAVGKVVWVEKTPYQDRYKLGIEFMDVDAEGQRYLREMVETRPRVSRMPLSS